MDILMKYCASRFVMSDKWLSPDRLVLVQLSSAGMPAPVRKRAELNSLRDQKVSMPLLSAWMEI